MPIKRPPPTRSIVAARDPALDSWFIKSYLRCWTPPATLPLAKIRCADSRAAQCRRLSHRRARACDPPSDPAWRAYADSAVRAVTKCNPLQVPARYLPHFEQWRKMTLHFSPDNRIRVNEGASDPLRRSRLTLRERTSRASRAWRRPPVAANGPARNRQWDRRAGPVGASTRAGAQSRRSYRDGAQCSDSPGRLEIDATRPPFP